MGFNLIENLLCNIWENEGPSAVLVCMTGWDDISSLRDKLKAHPFMGDPSRVLLIACHSSMASLEQRLIFEKPEDGVRKIVLATNIAETSITIYDVVFVVDCGKAKETSYDALNNTPCLLSSWISKVKFGSVRKFILFIYCSLFIKDEQSIKELPASAHTIGNDSWQQVSLMLITSFNCGWVLSFSKLMMVPMGWAWGITSLLLVGFFSCYSSWVLAGFHFIEGQRFIRYRDIMGFLFGKKLYYITYMLQFSTFILGNMGFILLGGKALKEINLVFSDTAMRLQYFIIITGVIYCTFAFVVPNLSSMRLWLGASVIFTFSYIGVLLVFTAKDAKSVANRDYEVRGSELAKVFNALGAIAAMIVSNNSGMIPEIQSTLQKPAVRNLRIAVCMQYTLGLMVYYGVSIAGYWIYGSAVPEYLPKALSGPKWAKVLINSAVFLQNVISQHMFFQPVHEALDTKFLRVDEPIYSRENLKRRFFLRTLVFTGNTLVTAAIPFMGDFINLLGSFTLITLTFIFPSMIFIKVKAKTAKTGHKAWHWILIVVFSLLAIATTISAARLIINNVRNYRLFANQ